jgi:hypothetical protein
MVSSEQHPLMPVHSLKFFWFEEHIYHVPENRYGYNK